MKSRRQARECILQVLYSCDSNGIWEEESIELYFQVLSPIKVDSLSNSEQANYNFARRILSGVLDKLAQVDESITAASTHWSIARMSRVDRNILRCAAYELQFEDDVPQNVTINEAIEISKRYGTQDSPTFINGVLDKVAQNLRKKASQAAQNEAKLATG